MSEINENEKKILEIYKSKRHDHNLGIVDDTAKDPVTNLFESESQISELEGGGTCSSIIYKNQVVEPVFIKEGVKFEGSIERCVPNPLNFLGNLFVQKEAEEIATKLIENAANVIEVDGDLEEKIINEGQNKIGWIADTFVVSRSQIVKLIMSDDLFLNRPNRLVNDDLPGAPYTGVVGNLNVVSVSLPEGILGVIYDRSNIQIAKTELIIKMKGEDNKTIFTMEEWCSVAPVQKNRTLKFVKKE